MTRPKDPESTEKEARLQQAVAEYEKRQKNPARATKYVSDALPRILTLAIKPSKTILMECNKAHEQSMHLTNEEEKELIHWITTLTQHDYAPCYHTVRE